MTCIAILSDFGSYEADVAYLKVRLQAAMPAIPIIDIAHNISPYHSEELCYLLQQSLVKGSLQQPVYWVLHHIFYTQYPEIVIIKTHENQLIVAPNNGDLINALTARYTLSVAVPALPQLATYTQWTQACIYQIQLLLTNSNYEASLTWQHFPRQTVEPITLPYMLNVCHIDNFGNAVTDFTQAMYDTLLDKYPHDIAIHFSGKNHQDIRKHYHEVKRGYLLFRFNSIGNLELCLNRENAAQRFSLLLGNNSNRLRIVNQNDKIPPPPNKLNTQNDSTDSNNVYTGDLFK